MVSATAGTLIRCDVPVKAFLHFLDSRQGTKFIIIDLDDSHVLVRSEAMPLIQTALDKLYDENQYQHMQ